MTDYLHALPSGYRIEEYELVRVLGSGGFGITYLGYDHHLDKAVAIKEYLPNDLAVRTDNNSVLPKSTQDKADYEWGLERFLSEAQTLARFDHRHIIKVHRFFRTHGTGYIVMEYAEGETLSEVLQSKGTLTEAESKAILFPILDGLEAVHEANFLHRDIKPGNIVIRQDGSPVLIDFGSARQVVARKSRSVTAIVTPGYAPIEQYSAKGHQGPWTDIYALGAVCYRCLAGEPPEDATERLREDPLVPASTRCKGKASAELLDAIDRALRVNEEERPQSIKEWRETLADGGNNGKPTRRPVTRPAGSSATPLAGISWLSRALMALLRAVAWPGSAVISGDGARETATTPESGIKAEAAPADMLVVKSSPKKVSKLKPEEIHVDAEVFQLKRGGDEAGVTDKLKDVEGWSPISMEYITAYQDKEGKLTVADGHQRVGLAKRLKAENPDADITLDAYVYRERDGFTPEQIKVIAAKKNIAQGRADAVFVAEIIRIDKSVLSAGDIPKNTTQFRQARQLAKLDDVVFDRVKRGDISPAFGAAVGQWANKDGKPDAQVQEAAVNELLRAEPENLDLDVAVEIVKQVAAVFARMLPDRFVRT